MDYESKKRYFDSIQCTHALPPGAKVPQVYGELEPFPGTFPREIFANIYSHVSDPITVASLEKIGDESAKLVRKYCATKIWDLRVSLMGWPFHHGFITIDQCQSDKFGARDEDGWIGRLVDWFEFLMKQSTKLQRLNVDFTGVDSAENLVKFLDLIPPRQTLVFLNISFPRKLADPRSRLDFFVTTLVHKFPNLRDIAFPFLDVGDPFVAENLTMVSSISGLRYLKTITLFYSFIVDFEKRFIQMSDNMPMAERRTILQFFLSLKDGASHFQHLCIYLKFPKLLITGITRQFPDLRILDIVLSFPYDVSPFALNDEQHVKVRKQFFDKWESDPDGRNLVVNLISKEDLVYNGTDKMSAVVEAYNSSTVAIQPEDSYDFFSLRFPVDVQAVLRADLIENLFVIRKGNATVTMNFRYERYKARIF